MANAFLPLVTGLLIYLTKAERTYITDLLHALRTILPVIRYPHIIRAFACDFLWTYSLFFCLRLALGDSLKGKHNLTVITVTVIAALLLETIQIFKVIPGTFDPMDIAAEISATAVALLITTIIERRFNHYEENIA